jgi:hypothetical protein
MLNIKKSNSRLPMFFSIFGEFEPYFRQALAEANQTLLTIER